MPVTNPGDGEAPSSFSDMPEGDVEDESQDESRDESQDEEISDEVDTAAGDEVDTAAGGELDSPAGDELDSAPGGDGPAVAETAPGQPKITKAAKSTPTKPATSKPAKAPGRATPKGGSPRAQTSRQGRYTPPIPKEVRRSPSWYPYVLLTFLIGGLLMIVLNYIHVLPGGTSNWYLLGGIGLIVGGLFMATRYH